MINLLNIIVNLALLCLLIYYTKQYLKNLKQLREYDRLNKKIKEDQEKLVRTVKELKVDIEELNKNWR